jgi:hypothetical protein
MPVYQNVHRWGHVAFFYCLPSHRTLFLATVSDHETLFIPFMNSVRSQNTCYEQCIPRVWHCIKDSLKKPCERTGPCQYIYVLIVCLQNKLLNHQICNKEGKTFWFLNVKPLRTSGNCEVNIEDCETNS